MPPKPRLPPLADPGEIGIGHRVEVHLAHGHVDVAVVVRAIALLDEERIVTVPVGPVR